MPGTPAADIADAEQDRILSEQRPVTERIIALKPVTLAGHQRRAQCLVSWAPDLLNRDGDAADRTLSAILRDLAAGSVT